MSKVESQVVGHSVEQIDGEMNFFYFFLQKPERYMVFV